MKKIFISGILVLVLAQPTYSQWDWGFEFNKAGSAGLQFLKIGVGARPSGMGEAFISLADDVNAIFWNPAGISYVTDREIAFAHTKWLVGVSHDACAITASLEELGVIGISFVSLGIEKFEETTAEEQDGTGRMVSAGDYAIGLAYGKRFTDRFSLGGHLRYVRETLDQDFVSSIIVDIGTLYYTGFRQTRIAMAVQNIGSDMKFFYDEFRTPTMFKIGLADELFKSETHSLTIALDGVHPTDNVERLHLGMEYWFMNKFALRMGYKFNCDAEGLAFGGGIRHELGPFRGKLDYAYNSFKNALGSVHRMSIIFSF